MNVRIKEQLMDINKALKKKKEIKVLERREGAMKREKKHAWGVAPVLRHAPTKSRQKSFDEAFHGIWKTLKKPLEVEWDNATQSYGRATALLRCDASKRAGRTGRTTSKQKVERIKDGKKGSEAETGGI
jgi:hypothetical protein